MGRTQRAALLPMVLAVVSELQSDDQKTVRVTKVSLERGGKHSLLFMRLGLSVAPLAVSICTKNISDRASGFKACHAQAMMHIRYDG